MNSFKNKIYPNIFPFSCEHKNMTIMIKLYESLRVGHVFLLTFTSLSHLQLHSYNGFRFLSVDCCLYNVSILVTLFIAEVIFFFLSK